MPSTVIRPSDSKGPTTRKGPAEFFTGDVFIDAVFKDENNAMSIANVTFTPCARTHWHTHESGQILHVFAGSGWICDKGGEPRRLHAGDMVWASPGTTHWHGADEGSYMTHLAISMGKATWHEQVELKSK
ncbi:uncharacterized protein FRV6_15385 [Fusarium oxysporum]|uniref:Cupin type-2 domain-containing protein n=1 Tax=Fusarium oxysporum TaxID=5507 RepID=A0A2H3TRN8_FUSOX|nr:uncharacterized protein FRV6_15385 [Fusarium oxysporum]